MDDRNEISKTAKGRVIKAIISLLALSAMMSMLPITVYAEPPVGRKWKMVWNDEFDGTAVDARKWTRCKRPPWNWPGMKTQESESSLVVKQGSLTLQLTQDPNGTVRYHRGFQSVFKTAFGYFETRVQFSQEPGWWTAVWLAGVPNDGGADTFVSSQEFDMYEDFYKPKVKNDIQHCYHCSVKCGFGTETKTTGFGNMLEVSDVNRVSAPKKVILKEYKGWHTVGLEWSPLEHIFYVDGKETLRQSYHDVPMTTVPQHIWISSCLRTPPNKVPKPFYGLLDDANFPDRFVVDYVRVYKEDTDNRKPPVVTLIMRGQGPFKKGEPVTFDVKARGDGCKIVSLMLFSMGRLRAETNANSAEAKMTFTVDGLFSGYQNTVIAMAKDIKGLVGMSDPVRVKVVAGLPSETGK